MQFPPEVWNSDRWEKYLQIQTGGKRKNKKATSGTLCVLDRPEKFESWATLQKKNIAATFRYTSGETVPEV